MGSKRPPSDALVELHEFFAIQHMSSKSVPWTIGVELEFLYAKVRHKDVVTECSPWYYYLVEVELLLSQQGLACNVHPHPGVPLDYSKWNITTESSIGCSPSVKGEEGLLSLSAVNDLHYWDVRAVELVSPPLPAPPSYNPDSVDSATVSLRKYVAGLRFERYKDSRSRHTISEDAKNTPFTTLTDAQCGFHVHVGVDPSFDKTSEFVCSIPLPVLQQFAMLQLRFEPAFSSMHSSSRRGDAKYCPSNSIPFRKDDHCCKRVGLLPVDDILAFVFHPDMTAKELAWRMGSEEPIRDIGTATGTGSRDERMERPMVVVDETTRLDGRDSYERHRERTLSSDSDDDHDSGCDMSRFFDSDGGDRYRIVNWSNLCRSKSEGPQTLEFRQADGTLDEEDVIHWVHLITAVICACERLANSPDQQSVWSNSNWEVIAPSVVELLELLEIGDPGIHHYWEQRIKRYEGPPDEFIPVLKDWEVCSVCALRHHGRLQSRKKRAELTRGYRHFGHMKRKDKSSAKQRQRDKNRWFETRRMWAEVNGTGEAATVWGDLTMVAVSGVEPSSVDVWCADNEVCEPPECGW
jgi:hypothetical protein